LLLVDNGSITNSANIIVSGGATFDVAGLASTFALSSGQTLSNGTLTAAGTINGAANANTGKISLNYTNGTPSLTVTGGALTLSSGTTVKVANNGPALAVGNYKIISKGAGGSVVGSPLPSVTVGGTGVTAGGHVSLSTNLGELFLNVAEAAPVIANTPLTNHMSAGLPYKIKISDLAAAAGWSDPDGDTITLSGTDATSALGTNITVSAGLIVYGGPVVANDSFGYTITDGTLTASGTIVLQVSGNNAPTLNITSQVNGGTVSLGGAGIPGHVNSVERTTDLTPPITWTPVGTATNGPDGLWQFTDPTPSSPAFYRAVTQ